MNENVIKVLKENMWDVATCADEVNVVPVAFKAVLADGRLAVADVFLKSTLENVAKNPQVAVSAYDAKTMEGYQIKGKAHYEAEGEIADSVKATVENATKGRLAAKGALVIDVEKVIVTTPGPDNKKVL